MRTGLRVSLSMVLVLALALAACDDDSESSDSSDPTSGESGSGSDSGSDSGMPAEITVTVEPDSLNVPDEIPSGAVTINIEGSAAVPNETEVDFSTVTEGTTEEEFTEAISITVQGGPVPDFAEANAGAITGEPADTITLEPGDHFVWTEVFDESAPDAPPTVLVAATTVTEGDGAELPETDGEFVASDFTFDVDAPAGTQYTFTNDGPDELHHAVLFDMENLDPAVVEENLPALFAADEGTPPPEPFADIPEENYGLGASGVFSPGLSGTFDADIQSGKTYVVACFISDRAGGPPHAIAHDMYEVFQVD